MKRALSKLKLASNSMPKPKYYAVAQGKEGPKVYHNWDECSKNVSRYPGAIHKSFSSLEHAETWLASSISLQAAPSSSRPVDSFSHSQKPYSRIAKPKAPTLAPEVVKAYRSNTEASTSKITLSDEQQAVLQRIKRGENIFFSGSAGTGKSVLLREIINELKNRDPRSSTLGITASTGIAAINIGGCTLHSWAGIGIGNESAKKMAGKFIGQAKHGSMLLDRWKHVKTLIIDEISMVDGQLFDKLEEMARLLRGNDAPFGGIQLVLSGDFFQLPPVPNRNGDEIITPVFAFDAKTWEICVGRPVTLTRVFRQKDQTFVTLLNAMRFGKIENVEAFTALAREVTYTDGLQPTELLSRREEVERVNNRRLDQLPGNCETYEAMDSRGTNSKGEKVSREQMERLLDRLVAPQSVGLKVGAQVMLIKNLAQGRLVNGSLGQVIGFSTAHDAIQRHVPIADQENKQPQHNPPPEGAQLWPLVRYTNGEEVLMIPQEFTINNADGGMEARRTQVPLILAWALSVHKSQGQTLERVKVDLKQTFEKGQAYVAVSRATTMEHLQILNFHPSKVVAHPRVQQWYTEIDRYRRVEEEMDMDDAMEAYYS
ncbi:ATP-dependent DNA helicase PIF1 [Mycena sanguinolenta]|uniref:ATP-dependent DNA helicase PIF1 n=1 Tax=Mycena sanguinolenta TaxID=230812 RepID=A0A8H6YXU7_9AGAR|nr:ATP-dependent DNA helicase PIF1 [Mycena sanguinolenta]